MTINCPACGEPIEFKASMSVNADRRADFRDAIIAGSFQREPCPKCAETFRLDPEMTYINIGRGQWISVYPFAKLGQWKELEEKSRVAFDTGYGSRAPRAVQEMGAAVTPRMTFGWAGLREKIVANEHQLDDVTLELMKLAIMRTQEGSPFGDDVELRFVGVEETKLIMAWIRAKTEEFVEVLKVPRQLYDDIAADEAGWEALRAELSEGLFVDTNRLLVPAAV
jgi:hypothetical protein